MALTGRAQASPLIGSCNDSNVELQYKACYARILDSKRRFLEAAQRYYELSQITSSGALGEDLCGPPSRHACGVRRC